MKSFQIALGCLLALVLLCVACALWGGALCRELETLQNTLPPRYDEEGSSISLQLRSLWEQKKFWLCLCLHQSLPEQYDRALGQLTAACEAKEQSAYLTAKEALFSALEALKQSAQISAEGFF